MKFFIPYIEDEKKAEDVWQATKAFAESQLGWHVEDERIFRLEYAHDGRPMDAEVGEPHPYGHPATWDYVPDYSDPRAGEYVVAILKSNAYLVCTHNRGVVRGEPIVVGLGEVRRVVYFDDHAPSG